jgi:uncharacterized protein
MLQVVHYVLTALYVALPPAAVVVDVFRARRIKRSAPSGSLVLSVFAAIPIGVLATLIYAKVMHSSIRLPQVLLSIYFATGMLLLLRAFDGLLRLPSIVLQRRAKRDPKRANILGMFDLLSGFVRIALLFAIGLPYVIAASIVYRPKVAQTDDPTKTLGLQFQPVSFVTSDRHHIAGWWIPATAAQGSDLRSPRGRRTSTTSDRTVIVCHGMTGDKSKQLSLVRPFVPRGYNVLVFDFRAHGDSDGQLFSYGDVERRDVLAAVRWLRNVRPAQSRHIYGVGVDTGGAALIAAAADESVEGQSIEAVAVYGTFDSLPRWTHAVMRDRFAQPLRFLLDRIALPLAGAQVGADLSNFCPAELAQHLWPRPILVIHGARDYLVDFDRGVGLFDAAGQPKDRLWISDEDHAQPIRDANIGRQVREFFDTARPVPVI